MVKYIPFIFLVFSPAVFAENDSDKEAALKRELRPAEVEHRLKENRIKTADLEGLLKNLKEPEPSKELNKLNEAGGIQEKLKKQDDNLPKGMIRGSVEHTRWLSQQRALALKAKLADVESEEHESDDNKSSEVGVAKSTHSKPSENIKESNEFLNSSNKNQKSTRKTLPKIDSSVYIPPATIRTKSSVYSKSTAKENKKYGVRIGTYFSVNLDRNISSVDSSEIEFVLSEPLVGDFGTIPAGTILFSKKAFNSNTGRLECGVNHGVMPDGTEFSLSASCYDDKRNSGLAGVVIKNLDTEVDNATKRGLLSIAGQAVSASTGNSIVGDGVEGVANTVIDSEKDSIKKVKSYIKVSPQSLLLRVDRTF